MIIFNAKMKTIGVLGCGWLGLPLAKHLIAQNFIVKGSTTHQNKIDSLSKLGIESFLIDVFSLEERAFMNFLSSLDMLIITIPPNRLETEPTYQKLFNKIIPFIKTAKIRRVIMMSSVSVYEPNKEIISEKTTLLSEEKIARQIIAAENSLLNESSFSTCILRLGGLFGNDRRPIKYIVQKGSLENPDLPINMIELRDIIQFTSAIVQNNFEDNCVYNIVSPNYTSRLDYYTKQANELNIQLPPLGKNDWSKAKKISGDKITKDTLLAYRY